MKKNKKMIKIIIDNLYLSAKIHSCGLQEMLTSLKPFKISIMEDRW